MGIIPALKQYTKLTALSLLAGGCILAYAPSASHAEGLETLLPYVIENHDRVRASKSSLTAARNRAREALGGWYPTLSQTANAGHETQENDDGADTRTGFSEYDFSLTQLLWDFGSTNATIDKARLEVESARFDLIETRQSLILEAITAYMNTIRSNAALGFAKESEGNIRKQTGLEEALVVLGSGFSTDVLQAKTQLAGAQARRAQSEGGLINALNRFQAVYGRMPDSIEALTPVPYPAAFLPLSLTQATDVALETNPSLKNAILDADIAKEDVRIARADNFTPKIEASAERKLKKNVGGTIGPKQESLAKVEMTFDFNLGFTAVNTLRASESDLSASTFTAADTRRTIDEQVRNAWQQLETAKLTASHLNNQANIAAAFLELARNERQLGRRSLIDVLSGETDLINAKSDALSAETDVLLAAYGLLAATGQLEYDVVKRSKGVIAPTIKQPSINAPSTSTAPAAAPTKPVTPIPANQSGAITPDVMVAEGRSVSDLQAMFTSAERTNEATLPDIVETYGRVAEISPTVALPVTEPKTTQTRYTFLHDQDTDARSEVADETTSAFEYASSDQQNDITSIKDTVLPSNSDTAVYSTPDELAVMPILETIENTKAEISTPTSYESDDEVDHDDSYENTEIAAISATDVPTSGTLGAHEESFIGFRDVISFFEDAAKASKENSDIPTVKVTPQATEVASLPPTDNVKSDTQNPLTSFFGDVFSFLETAKPIETNDADDIVASTAPTFETPALTTDKNSNTHNNGSNALFDIFDFLDNAHQASLEGEQKTSSTETDPVRSEIDQITTDGTEENQIQKNVFAFLSDLLNSAKVDMSNVSFEPVTSVSFEEFDGN